MAISLRFATSSFRMLSGTGRENTRVPIERSARGVIPRAASACIRSIPGGSEEEMGQPGEGNHTMQQRSEKRRLPSVTAEIEDLRLSTEETAAVERGLTIALTEAPQGR